MYIYSIDIVLQEIPTEISLCISVCGCSKKCPGCHSAHLWNENNGRLFTEDDLSRELDRYLFNGQYLISCVLFMGGEWTGRDLERMCEYVKARGLKTALYTGEDDVSPSLRNQLDYLKTGGWIFDLGGLDNPNTNQKLIEVKTGKLLNKYFIHEQFCKAESLAG